MPHEEVVRKFMDAGYKVVVIGSGASIDDLKRLTAEAIEHGKTVLIPPYNGSPVVVEAGAAVIESRCESIATLVASLPCEALKLSHPVTIVSKGQAVGKSEAQYKYRSQNHKRKL